MIVENSGAIDVFDAPCVIWVLPHGDFLRTIAFLALAITLSSFLGQAMTIPINSIATAGECDFHSSIVLFAAFGH